MSFYVYELIDPRTGLVFYVGKGKGKRAFTHKHQSLLKHNSAKNRLIKELLAEGLEYNVNIVQYYDNEQLAYNAEADLIDQYGLDNLTNNKAGGGRLGEWKHSEETIAKIKAKLSDPSIRQAMRDRMLGENNPMYGKTRSPESLKQFLEKVSGENHHMYGKHHSDDTKRKISESLSGRTLDDEQRQLRSDNMKSTWEKRKNNSEFTQFQLVDPTGKVIVLQESLEDFCKKHGTDTTTLRRSAKQERIVARGYWKGWKAILI